jgi:hypothetical protein
LRPAAIGAERADELVEAVDTARHGR